jgi:hypothetical protein
MRKCRGRKHVAPRTWGRLPSPGPMDNVTTLPRRSWTERLSLALAAILVVIGAGALAGWVFHVEVLVAPLERLASIKVNEALCFLAIGLALLGREFGIGKAPWRRSSPRSSGS